MRAGPLGKTAGSATNLTYSALSNFRPDHGRLLTTVTVATRSGGLASQLHSRIGIASQAFFESATVQFKQVIVVIMEIDRVALARDT